MKALLFSLLLAYPLWAERAPETVVESLYRADLAHYGRPSKWVPPAYRIVPYHDTYFASTCHSQRQAPDTFAIWEWVGGGWHYIFEVETGPGDPPEAFQAGFQAKFARNGFSSAMEKKLLTSERLHAFPADLPHYSAQKTRLYQQLRRAAVRHNPDLEDRHARVYLHGDAAMLLMVYAIRPVYEVWRHGPGGWRFWATVPDPSEPGSEAEWIKAGITPGLRSKLVFSPEDTLPY